MNSVNFKVKALVAVLAAGMLAGAASAQTVQGGGATLPEKFYKGIFASGNVIGSWTYLGTGSGTGKKAFLTNNASLFNTTGNVHFAGSDSALSAADLTTYEPNKAAFGPVIQIPAVLTSVTLPYKRAGVTQVNLTNDQVCKVFSNQITTWGGILGNGDTTPIRVVYRSDSSGTTELLATYLKEACPASYGFTKSSTFTAVVAGIPGGLPANWVAANGSSGVKTALETDGSFSYLSPDYDYAPNDASKVAKINGQLPTNISIPDSVVPPGNTGTLDPKNQLNWVPGYVLPATAGPRAKYPIYGTTNLLINQCYADGVGATTVGGAVKDFVTKLNNGGYDSLISQHQFVKLPASWLNAIKSVFITGDSNGLNIGNASVCNGKGRPS
ncbi:substrate-binding domain-containing protein [Paludibacterium paludis]|uniref:Phosphate-binding protein PstS n=1 Tax=Paludibacterium paludis TaxID=1225769 RepID=A0A918NXE4_9NEIS|nr:substrate-binding domain-containing protein [Paludibacterium paludis]GGY04313.1 alkaline phosphatase L [Paludibacterium paludis]